MGIITAVEPQKKKKTRVNLYIDGRFFCGLEHITLLAAGLKEGDEADEGVLSALIADSETAVAFEKTVKLVSARLRTEREIARYLKEKGYPPLVSERVIEKLYAYRYLDDGLYAKSFAAAYRKKYGDRYLSRALKQKGLDDAVIAEALEEIGEGREEDAVRAAEKYARTHAALDRGKLYAYLTRRGFLPEEIKNAVRKVSEDADGDGEEYFFD
ncbi:MAG: recombination regulator RecX [Clostridiales bacterium]|jgi:regulatory protein|nr:recombination regulator RecX [Clostridiales bacterium]